MLFVGGNVAFAYVASSTNYRIQTDSVNMGGGLSSSTNYAAQDTLGEVVSGTSTSASYGVKAGYQQMQDIYIAISSPGNVTLAPLIPSVGGGVANGQATWTVITDNQSGYSLSVSAASSPALVSGLNSFANYTPAGADPDFNFSVPAASAEFGFTPEGNDVVSRFLDNGAACNTGSGNTTDRCWAPLLTSLQSVAQKNSANAPTGSALTLKFRAQSGAANTQPAGSYTATATLTVMAL